MKGRHFLWVLVVALIGGFVLTKTAVVLENDEQARIVAAKERVVYTDDPEEGRLVLKTVGGKVGGSWDDVAIYFQDWRHKHPDAVPTLYRLTVQYTRRDSVRVGQ